MNALVSVCRRRACSFVSQQDGVAATKYAVVLALFVVASLGAVWLLGGSLTSTVSTISDNVPDASPGGSHGPSSGTFEPVYSGNTHLSPPRPNP
jgi:Flp pilus assembly pilin Flp